MPSFSSEDTRSGTEWGSDFLLWFVPLGEGKVTLTRPVVNHTTGLENQIGFSQLAPWSDLSRFLRRRGIYENMKRRVAKCPFYSKANRHPAILSEKRTAAKTGIPRLWFTTLVLFISDTQRLGRFLGRILPRNRCRCAHLSSL